MTRLLSPKFSGRFNRLHYIMYDFFKRQRRSETVKIHAANTYRLTGERRFSTMSFVRTSRFFFINNNNYYILFNYYYFIKNNNNTVLFFNFIVRPTDLLLRHHVQYIYIFSFTTRKAR